ncbi:Hypothetical predicted protein [Cloeon dipterum]|uniref:Uncharacterized protein n=1 Tax=Cloeon dipterum TaxID=197152 RepID=A0A8S1D2N3_9INSE|nr:Hypothetical predicted protein [Cloeon dipterum]
MENLERNTKGLDLEDGEELCLNLYMQNLESNPHFNQHIELEKIIKTLSEHGEKVSPSDAERVFSKIIGSDIKHVNFKRILNLYPSEPGFALEVLKMIASNATKIAAFLIMREKNESGLPSKMEQQMWSEIGKMKTLGEITIDVYYFTLQDLLEMCQNLTCLRTLIVQIVPESQLFPSQDRGLLKKFNKSFGQLKIFYFSSLWRADDVGEIFQKELTLYCVKNLLNLQEVGDPKIFIDMTPLCTDTETRKMSQNKLLMIKMEQFEAEPARQVKNLSLIDRLWIDWGGNYKYRPIEETKLHLLQQFKKLDVLIFTDLKCDEYLNFFLTSYGKRLIGLYMTYIQEAGEINGPINIHEMCPKLDFLHFTNILVFKNFCMKNFPNLKDLGIVFSRYASAEVPLADLFAPPNLEKVFITFACVSRKELLKCVDLVKQKKILRQIHRFDLKTANSRGSAKLIVRDISFTGKMENLERKTKDHKKMTFNEYVKHVESNPNFNRQIELEDKIKTFSEYGDEISPSEALSVFSTIISSDSNISRVNFKRIINLYPSEPGFALEVLKMFASNATKIAAFLIKMEKNETGLPSKMEHEMWSEIGKMKTLVVINIDVYHFTLQDLLEMCQNLTCLRTLIVQIYPESQLFPSQDRGLLKKFNKSFGQLKKFYFSSLWTEDDAGEIFQKELTLFCVKNLLNLQQVGDPEFFIDMTPLCTDTEMRKMSQNKLLMIKMKQFDTDLDRQVNNLSLTNRLWIDFGDNYKYRPIKETKLHLLQQFKKLKTLMFTDLNSDEYFDLFLTSYGNRLFGLHLNCKQEEREINGLRKVQELCPNLNFLHFSFILGIRNVSMKDFTNLKDLGIVFSRFARAEVPLADLFAPPNLERVFITFACVSRKELLKTVDLVKQKKILRKIHRFDLRVKLLRRKMYLGPGNNLCSCLKEYIEFLVKLPTALRERELEKFLSQLNSSDSCDSAHVKLILSLLITSKTKSFSFDRINDLYSSNPSFVIEVIELVLDKAKKLKAIKKEGEDLPNPPLLQPEILYEISKLRKLKALEICSFGFILSELMYMCREMPSLRKIYVRIAAQSSKSMQSPEFLTTFKKSFRQLSEFRFTSFWTCAEFIKSLTFCCIKNLPNLEAAGSPDVFLDMIQACRDQKKKSRIRHLDFSISNLRELESVSLKKFPRVRSLCVKWVYGYVNLPNGDESNLKILTGLKKLDSLKFINLDSKLILRLFLMAYGKNLKSLSLAPENGQGSNMDLQLEKIYQLCPKLESLSVRRVKSFTFDPRWYNNLNSTVKELKLSLRPGALKRDLPLSDLMLQPHLETVLLRGFKVSMTELELTNNLVQNGKILSKLKSFLLDVSAVEPKNPAFHHRLLRQRDFEANLRSWRPEASITVYL